MMVIGIPGERVLVDGLCFLPKSIIKALLTRLGSHSFTSKYKTCIVHNMQPEDVVKVIVEETRYRIKYVQVIDDNPSSPGGASSSPEKIYPKASTSGGYSPTKELEAVGITPTPSPTKRLSPSKKILEGLSPSKVLRKALKRFRGHRNQKIEEVATGSKVYNLESVVGESDYENLMASYDWEELEKECNYENLMASYDWEELEKECIECYIRMKGAKPGTGILYASQV